MHGACLIDEFQAHIIAVRLDLLTAFDRLAPRDVAYIHSVEGPDDMPAHVKAALTATSVSIPILKQKLALGTGQGIYLWEHRRRGGDVERAEAVAPRLADDQRPAVRGDHRVPGVVAAGVAHDVVDPLTQQVGNLALALVAPLSADDDDSWHGPSLRRVRVHPTLSSGCGALARPRPRR